jgi:hypothetical protein
LRWPHHAGRFEAIDRTRVCIRPARGLQ